MKNFKPIISQDTFLNRVQNNMVVFGNQFLNNPLLDGRLIEDVSLTTSETSIEHKLDRDYRGWLIVNKNAAQDVYVSSTTLKSRFLKLTAGGAVTVSIWVF